MVNPDLAKYISQLRTTNVADVTIKEQLVKTGWSEDEVVAALAPLNNPSAAILPPPPVPRFSMWISFQYVLLFVTLWVWSIALGGIWHYMVNKHIPDTLSQSTGYNYRSIVHDTLLPAYSAAIIVAFPFFAILFISLTKTISKNPGIRNIKIRKFLMYFTVVVNFLYMLSQLIGTVYGFLNATTSTTTIPHLLINMVIPGLICFYILYEVREDRKNTL